MSQVSKRPVEKDVERHINEIFRQAIANLSSQDEIESFLHDLLSPVEEIMLAKRLAIAVLLAKNYTYHQISHILYVTPSTIASVSLQFRYAGKGYKAVVEKISLDERRVKFWGRIEDLLTSLPPARGFNPYYISEQVERKEARRRKAF